MIFHRNNIKKIISALIVIFIATNTIAQALNSDSLRTDLESYKKKDSVLVLKTARYAQSISQLNPPKAIELFNIAIKLSREVRWNKLLARLYLSIGKIYVLEEKYDDTISNLLFALKIAEDSSDKDLVFDIHFDLSEAYRLMGNKELTGVHAQKCIEIASREKDDFKMLSGLLILAHSYVLKDNWDSAAPMLDKAMMLAVNKNSEYMQQQVISIRADHLINIKDFKGALELYRPNLAFQYKTGDNNGVAWVYSVMAMLHADLNNKDSAYYHADSALAISKRFNLAKELKDSYEALFYCYRKFGDYKKALEYRLLYDSIHTASFNMAAGQKAERARMELEIQRKDAKADAEAILSKARQARTRNLLFAGLGLFALAAIFLFLNNRQKQKAKAKIEKAYGELKATQQQLVQAEKMASLGELTAGIAHEIQNPLNFVNNFSEVNKELVDELKNELAAGNSRFAGEIADDIKDNSEKINHHGKRAEAIVKGMLQHSRSNSGQKEPTDINSLCDEYIRLSYHGLRAKDKSFNAKFETSFDPSVGKINIVPQDFGRVILNLINNAFYAVNEKRQKVWQVTSHLFPSVREKRVIK